MQDSKIISMFNKDLYDTKYHNIYISKYKFLITRRDDFIGPNLVEYLLKYGA